MPLPAWALSEKTVKSSTYDVLLGESSLAEAIVQTAVPRLSVAPSTLDLLGVELEIAGDKDRAFRLKNAVSTLAAASEKGGKHYDYILIDCPPSLKSLTINALASANSVVRASSMRIFCA